MNFNIYDYIDVKMNARKEAEFNEQLFQRKYVVQLLNDLVSMIEYENVPEGLDTYFLEMFKLVNGQCAVIRDNDKYIAIPGSFSGEPDAYGIGTRYVGNSLGGGHSFNGEIGKDCIVFKNNHLYSADILNVMEYADLFTQVKISKRLNVIYSRYLPIFGVADTKTKRSLEEVIKQIGIGVPQVAILKDLESIIEGSKSFERLDITDVRNNDMLQYIDKFEDDLLRGFYSYYGHAMNGTTKLAQQSVAEVTNNDSVSAIYPLNRLKCAEESCRRMNELFGTNMTCHFSKAWEVRQNDLTQDIEEAEEEEGGEENDIEGISENEE